MRNNAVSPDKKKSVTTQRISTKHPSLVRLRPRNYLHYISHSRMVWATNRDGVISGSPEEGLFYFDTRLLSCYKYFVNESPPDPVALSAIDHQTWMGYYILFPPGHPASIPDAGSGMVPKATEQTLELRILRRVLGTASEQIEFTNHTQAPTQFVFEIELDSDFADLSETSQERIQKGKISRRALHRFGNSRTVTHTADLETFDDEGSFFWLGCANAFHGESGIQSF